MHADSNEILLVFETLLSCFDNLRAPKTSKSARFTELVCTYKHEENRKYYALVQKGMARCSALVVFLDCRSKS